MLTGVTVENFRNLRAISLERLGRITLIAGKNGTGKTALLEALWLHSGADLPELSTRVAGLRGLPLLGPESLFQDMFRDFDTQSTIRVSATGDWGKGARTLVVRLGERKELTTIRSDARERSDIQRLTQPESEGETEIVFTYTHNNKKRHVSRAWWVAQQLSPAGSSPALTVTGEGVRQQREPIKGRATSIFMAAVNRENLEQIASRLGVFQLAGEEGKVVEFVRPLEPRLTGLTTITIKNTPVIHASIKGTKRPIPVQLLGEGFNRMLQLALSFGEARGGLVLVDEIENGLHHSVHEEMFSHLLSFTQEFDTQIFATTHSAECIRAAHRSLEEKSQGGFVYFHFERVNGDIEAIRFDREMLDTSIEHHMEVR